MDQCCVQSSKPNNDVLVKDPEPIFPEEDSYYECILTQYRERNPETQNRKPLGKGGGWGHRQTTRVNASVVGVIRKGRSLCFDLYEGSNSYFLIQKNSVIAVNIPTMPDGVDDFITAALTGYGNDTQEFEPSEMETVETPMGSAPIMKGPGISLVCVVENIANEEREDEFGRSMVRSVDCTVQSIVPKDLPKNLVIPYSRTTGLFIETLILGTRYMACGTNSSEFSIEKKQELSKNIEKNLRLLVKIGGEKTMRRVERIKGLLYSSSSSSE